MHLAANQDGLAHRKAPHSKEKKERRRRGYAKKECILFGLEE